MKIKSFLSITTALCVSAITCLAGANVGESAPAFNLKDTKGNTVSLDDHKGKIVVLEWINYGCPFVKKHYSVKNMQGMQEKYGAKDVVWLSVHSAHEGHPTYLKPSDLQSEADKQGAAATSILLDPSGTTGKAYGAKTTPHMYIIDKDGKLAYAGGIDSIKSAKSADVEKAEPFFKNALEEVISGKPVTKASTPPYGCSVKYAN